MENIKADNERELTSTMGNVLSMSSKDEKNDTSDATPTSSTDASTTTTASQIVSDDPISSTSSDIIEQKKSKVAEVNMQNSLEVNETAVDEPDKSTTADPEADLLEMSISNVSSEKITEDVEDLVHDLESLLGESTDSFNIPIKRKEDRKSPDENEDRKSLDDTNSPDVKEAGESPEEKGDGDALDERETTNHPQTSSEEIREMISSGEPVPDKILEDQDVQTEKDQSIPDRSIFSIISQAEVPKVEIQESKFGHGDESSETKIDKNVKDKGDELNKEIIAENDIEGNKEMSVSDKNDENSSNSDDLVPPQVKSECKNTTEGKEDKSDMVLKENEKIEENVTEITESNVNEVFEARDTGGLLEENKKDADKQEDNVEDKEVVENPKSDNIKMVEQVDKDSFENSEIKELVQDNSKNIETGEDPKDAKDSEVSSVVYDKSGGVEKEENPEDIKENEVLLVVENKSEDIEKEENPKDVKENEVSSIIEDQSEDMKRGENPKDAKENEVSSVIEDKSEDVKKVENPKDAKEKEVSLVVKDKSEDAKRGENSKNVKENEVSTVIEDESEDGIKGENPKDVIENAVSSAVEDTPSGSVEAQEKELAEAIEQITSASENETFVEGVESTCIVELENCSIESISSKESIKDNEPYKEEKAVEEAVERTTEDESIADVKDIKDDDTEHIEKKSEPQESIIEEGSSDDRPAAPSLGSESKTKEESLAHDVEEYPGKSVDEQCKEEGCGQVDGTVTENEENKLKTDRTVNPETEECEAEVESSSKSEVEEATELVTEDVGKETDEVVKKSTEDEKMDDVGNVSESESRINIPESTIEIVPEDGERKLENVVLSNPIDASTSVIEDLQCSTSPDVTAIVQPIAETKPDPKEIESSSRPPIEPEPPKTPVAEETTPVEVSIDECAVTVKNKEIVDIISKSEQIGDDDAEGVETEVENVQSSSGSTLEISEEVVNPKSVTSAPNEPVDELTVKPSVNVDNEVEYIEPSKESAKNSTLASNAVGQNIQPEAKAEELSEDIAITDTEPKAATAEEAGSEVEVQPSQENIANETREASTVEAAVVDEDPSKTDTLADADSSVVSKDDLVNIQSEDLVENALQIEKSEAEVETTERNDETSKQTGEISKTSDASQKTNEETSNPIEETLEFVNEICEPSKVSNSSDECNKTTVKTAELDGETSKPAEEAAKLEEISTPVEEISGLDDDGSKLESESPRDITTENVQELVYSIETTQVQQTYKDAVEPDLGEKIESLEDLTEETDGEKSSSEEMVVIEQSQDDKENSNKVIEISDDDSKAAGGDTDSVQILSSNSDSDSEDMVPVLVLEPDDDIPSPKEPIAGRDDTEVEDSSVEVHPSDVAAVTEPLPEIEDILTDQARVDEAEAAVDVQENLETILAVASLQNAESIEVTVEAPVEPEMSEKERREMEALRKAVESITDNTAIVFEDDVDEVVVELAVPAEVVTLESESGGKSESSPQAASADLVEDKVDMLEVEVDETELGMKEVSDDKSDEDVVELKVEESVEQAEVTEEDSADENPIELKLDEAVQNRQALPDTSEDKVVDSETKQPETKDDLPDSSQSVLVSEEGKQSDASREREAKTKGSERSKRHKKSSTDSKLEELSINVDVPDKDKPYSPKVIIKPIKVPDEEVSTTSNSDSEIGKGSLKMTITKQSDKMHSILKICDPESSESAPEQEEPIPKLIIKPKMQQVEQQHSPKMSTRSCKQVYSPTSTTQRSGSPRITIKPVVKPEKVETLSPLKIKIKPEDISKKHNPKVNIKPIAKPEEEVSREVVQTSRKVIIKPVVKPAEEPEQVHSPRITIKPIPKPEAEKESTPATPRFTIKPIKKQEDDDSEVDKERSSPKITIKPVIKPQEPDTQTAEGDEEVKERIVLKINKGNLPTPTKESKKREHPPDDEKSEKLAKITVKFSKGGGHPHIVQQPEESNKRSHEEQATPEKVKKQRTEIESPISTRSKHKEPLPEATVETRSKQKEVPSENPTGDAAKTKQKDSEPVHESLKTKHKDPNSESPIEPKRAKLKDAAPEAPIYESTRSRQKETPGETQACEATKSKHKEPNVPDKPEPISDNTDDIKIVETKMDSPIVISEDSGSQDSGSCVIVDELKDPLSAIPVFEITAESAKAMLAKSESAKASLTKTESVVSSTPSTPPTPTPRKRGRPRKVPIVVREDFKEQEEPSKADASKEDVPQAAPESGRPKRSCRGQSARATLGIKPRKPRGPGRGRGSKRGMGTRSVPMKPEGEVKLSKAKLKLMQQNIKEELARTAEQAGKEKKALKELEGVIASNVGIKPPTTVAAPSDVASSEIPASPFTIFPVPSPQGPVVSPAPLPGASPKPATPLLTADTSDFTTGLPTVIATASGAETSELVMVDEETRMSADTNSRAQTPAKQVIPADAIIEESQSSVQSTATTESGKAPSSRPNKAPRLEVQEPEGAVISADQLTEYYWNGNGPFMLQEQVAQFLGIKSFKRKYPGIMRRMLEMQERDFIRESGLASEHMCDLGLTAVNSADILDIMYSDFQDKYEEYCKHQRDRQAKDLINKQKALTLAASQEKNKADITEQAVQSAAQWNATFNKARKEQRKACMDLQTLTVHYPKGKIKQINKAKVGNYPVALVPGQFTDYYQEFTPTEINNLPINTMCYDPINIIPAEESDDSGSEGSDSDSDSSSSSSGSGSDSSSGVEDCKLCKHSPKKVSPTK